jgi:cysteinyl-tRNA synthetase
LDAGRAPGPSALDAWRRADAVLDATTASETRAVSASDAAGPVGDALSEQPPTDLAVHAEWARNWASRRLAAKTRRDFAEADRIRALLQTHGWEVRDRKDGSIEVSRRH